MKWTALATTALENQPDTFKVWSTDEYFNEGMS